MHGIHACISIRAYSMRLASEILSKPFPVRLQTKTFVEPASYGRPTPQGQHPTKPFTLTSSCGIARSQMRTPNAVGRLLASSRRAQGSDSRPCMPQHRLAFGFYSSVAMSYTHDSMTTRTIVLISAAINSLIVPAFMSSHSQYPCELGYAWFTSGSCCKPI